MRMTLKSCTAMLFVAALLAGCGASPLLQGNDAFRNGDFETAEAHWQPLAEAGDVDAQHNLGILHRHRGEPARAAQWWERAAADEFVPSMLELGHLRLAEGEIDAALAMYRRAARWGNDDAAAVLEALGQPVPNADLLMARMQHTRLATVRAGGPVDRPDPNERINRHLDELAARAENDGD